MKKETLYVLTCYSIWGAFPLFWYFLEGINAMCLLGWRALFSLVVILALIAKRKDWVLLRDTLRNWRLSLRIMVAGLLIYANWGIYIWCTTNNHRLDSSLAYYMTPLMAILLGLVFYKERMKPRQWLAVAITLVGVAYTIVVAGQWPWVALILGASMAFYGAVKKPVKLPFQITLAIETIVIAPLSVAVLLWCQRQGLHPDYAAMGWRLALIPISGVVTIVPLAYFAKGIATTSLHVVGMFQYISPTLQMLVALLLGDVLTQNDCILFGFVWLGILVYVVPDLWQMHKNRGEKLCA